VRLCGVAAPQPGGHHGAKSKALGQQALAAAARLCAGGTVRLELPDDESRGLTGALRAYVYLSDGTCLNLTLIEAGLARCDGSFHRRGGAFAEAERRAQHQHAGMWKDWVVDEDAPAGVGADDGE
jgi:endonuclease YncB( thermonuclease family)